MKYENKNIAIEFNNVTKNYGNLIAVNNISFAIEKGSVTTLLGPNGAGKSTTIGMMLGIIEQTKGKILLNGKVPTKAKNRQVLGAMLQNIGLPDTLKPIELIKLWSSYYYNPLNLYDVIDRAGLGEIQHTKFKDLSGGQKRRVAFALAICGNPDILFLDEPSAGLDIHSRNLLWEQIQLFSSSNKTVLLCTHYLDEADALSDRIILINKGEIIADDTPFNIKQQVGIKIIKCKTSTPLSLIEDIELIEDVKSKNGVLTIETTNAENVLKKLFHLDSNLRDLEVLNTNLEDAFLKLTANETN